MNCFRTGVISAVVAALFCGAVFAGCFRPPMTCDRKAMYEAIEAFVPTRWPDAVPPAAEICVRRVCWRG